MMDNSMGIAVQDRNVWIRTLSVRYMVVISMNSVHVRSHSSERKFHDNQVYDKYI